MMPYLRVICVRHGESSNNVLMSTSASAYTSGRSADAPLTAKGKEQAEVVAAHIRKNFAAGNPPVAQVYASPMCRAVDTGAAIAKSLGLPLRLWPSVCEVGGIFELVERTGAGDGSTAQWDAELEGVTTKTTRSLPGLGASELISRHKDLEIILPADGTITEAGWWKAGETRGKETVSEAIARTHEVFEKLKAWAASLPLKDGSAMDVRCAPAHVVSAPPHSHAVTVDAPIPAAFDTPAQHGTEVEQAAKWYRSTASEDSKAIVIVCHGDFLNHLVNEAAGVGESSSRFCHNNCGVTVFDIFPNGQVRILCVNDVAHFKMGGRDDLLVGAPW